MASVATQFRDSAAILPVLFQAGLFLTPVGYPASAAPERVRTLLDINPLTGYMEAWRWSLLGTPVSALPLVLAGAWTVLMTVGAWQLFTRMEIRFADFV
jgi:lipopolysaccharide transport system permease protein